MKESKTLPLDFIIDKLTNSIENTVTGEVFDTVITLLKAKIGVKSKNLIGNLIG